MKKIVFTCILALCSGILCAQTVNLQNLINKTYNKTDGKIFGRLCFVIPWELGFIDTAQNNTQAIAIKYFKSTESFKEHLEKETAAVILRVKVNSVSPSKMVLTVSISRAKATTYTDTIKVYSYIDERQVSLIYSPQMKEWKFDKLVKVLSDFHPLKN